MVLLNARRGEQFMVGAPRLSQLIGMAVLSPIGRLFGYRSTYVAKRSKPEVVFD